MNLVYAHSTALCIDEIQATNSGRDAALRRPAGAARRPYQRTCMLFSCALDSKCETTASNAARIYKCGLRILKELFNYWFGFATIHDLCVDHIEARIVSSHHPAVPKGRRIFAHCGVGFATLGMNENRTALRVWTTGRNRCEREQNQTFTRLRPSQTMPARKCVGRIRNHRRVIRGASRCHSPRSFGDFGRKRNNAEY